MIQFETSRKYWRGGQNHGRIVLVILWNNHACNTVGVALASAFSLGNCYYLDYNNCFSVFWENISLCSLGLSGTCNALSQHPSIPTAGITWMYVPPHLALIFFLKWIFPWLGKKNHWILLLINISLSGFTTIYL
jgi:hypothetical protein